MAQRVLSGVQPSGVLHIGNYLGAIKQWVDLQENYDCMYCVVDLHAITVPQDPKELKKNILAAAAMYLALGVDPKKSTIFIQSEVKEHTELAWILNTIARISELKLMHQFKEKSKGKEGNISMGLFDYPILMAADILLYNTDVVPVGEDQKQHVELTRELARRFNAQFKPTFKEPKEYFLKETARVMGLDNPEKKMSKSATSEKNYIALLDTPDSIRTKIKKAVTDSNGKVKYGKENPAISNLLTLYNASTNKTVKEIEKEYAEKGYKEFKEDLAEAVIDHLAPIQKEYNRIMKDKAELTRILDKGAESARERAAQTMAKVQKATGLGR